LCRGTISRRSDRQFSIMSVLITRSTVRELPNAVLPIQVNGQMLPVHGIGLIIATDSDRRLAHRPIAALPLPSPNGPIEKWAVGSSSALRGARVSSPYIEVLWFRVGNTEFIASAKIGSTASSADFKALAQAVHSLQL
jgi:hypothetical protein